jgi:PEP-CTERM motif
MSGLPADVLAAGITGNILLTGHDADVHTVLGYDSSGSPGDAVGQAASKFLDQAIARGDAGAGTGFVALADYSTAFAYLPAAWGITATGGLLSETVDLITAAGTASGVYNDLTAAAMSNWQESYHDKFTAWGSDFQSFEIGGVTQDINVTIGAAHPVPEPGTLLLLGSGLAGLVGIGRKKLLGK